MALRPRILPLATLVLLAAAAGCANGTNDDPFGWLSGAEVHDFRRREDRPWHSEWDWLGLGSDYRTSAGGRRSEADWLGGGSLFAGDEVYQGRSVRRRKAIGRSWWEDVDEFFANLFGRDKAKPSRLPKATGQPSPFRSYSPVHEPPPVRPPPARQ